MQPSLFAAVFELMIRSSFVLSAPPPSRESSEDRALDGCWPGWQRPIELEVTDKSQHSRLIIEHRPFLIPGSAPGREGHLGRQPEARTIHALRRRNIPDMMHGDLTILDIGTRGHHLPIPVHSNA